MNVPEKRPIHVDMEFASKNADLIKLAAPSPRIILIFSDSIFEVRIILDDSGSFHPSFYKRTAFVGQNLGETQRPW